MDASTPVVSVVVTCYKVKDYIADCIRSLFRQTLQEPFEIIVVEDACPQHGLEVAKTLEPEAPAHIGMQFLRHDTNRGPGATRNTGTDAARGKFVYYIDGDDELYPEALERLLEAGRRHGADITTGVLRTVSPDNEQRCRVHCEGFFENERAMSSFLKYEMDGAACGKLVSLEFIRGRKVAWREGLLHEDEVWNIDMLLAGATIYGTPHVVYKYKIGRQGSIMSSKAVDHLRTCMEACNANAESFLASKFRDWPEVIDRLASYSLSYVTPALKYAASFRGWKRWGVCRQMARNVLVAEPVLCNYLRRAGSRRARLVGIVAAMPAICCPTTLLALYFMRACRFETK